MKTVLITGSSGNVGKAVLKHLSCSNCRIIKTSYRAPFKTDERYFNFDDLDESGGSLQDVDVLFLMRPPHISDTRKYFEPMINLCLQARVKHIVFLSVQGVEKSSIIPHHKIERLILESKIPYTFVRPSYFMQNLTTTLLKDIRAGQIYLPAGNARFLWIDVNDIGKAIAAIITNHERHTNKTYTITGTEYFTFRDVADKLSLSLGRTIEYISPDLISFVTRKMREGMTLSHSLVLIMLHFVARFQDLPAVTNDFKALTGEDPATLDSFIRESRYAFLGTHEKSHLKLK